MQSAFQQQLTRFAPQQTEFLIGLSGGVDSVALLHLFVQARAFRPLKLRAVHIHHGLSPNAAAWATFCRQLCAQYDVPLVVQQVEVKGKHGLEANARQARYHAVAEMIAPSEYFVTAHHLDDQAETFLLALKRGSGVKGLGAMQAVSCWQNLTIFRPLIAFPKAELLAYAYQHGLRWVEDESNADTTFDRNFLRRTILPQLNARWPQFNQMVARASQHCQEQQQLVEELLRPDFEQCLDPTSGALTIQHFPHFSPLKQRQLLRLWLAHCGEPMPSSEQLNAILTQMLAAQPDKQPQVVLGEHQIRRYQQQLFVVKPLPNLAPATYTLPPTLKHLALAERGLDVSRDGTALICTFSRQTYRLSLPQTLSHHSLCLQFGATGKVAVYGKDHREQMKKLYQQYRIPPWLRPHTPVIFWQGQFVDLVPFFH